MLLSYDLTRQCESRRVASVISELLRAHEPLGSTFDTCKKLARSKPRSGATNEVSLADLEELGTEVVGVPDSEQGGVDSGRGLEVARVGDSHDAEATHVARGVLLLSRWVSADGMGQSS